MKLGKLRRAIGALPSRQMLEQDAAQRLQLQVDAFAAGYERSQLDDGLDPAAEAETSQRLRAAAAYYVGELYRAANPGIAAGRVKSASFEGGKQERGPDNA